MGLNKEQFKQMYETVMERSGVELDTPELSDFWKLMEDWQAELDIVTYVIVEQSAKYLEPINE